MHGSCLHRPCQGFQPKGKPLKSGRKIISGTPLCRQAILYRRDAIGAYDLNFRIMADRC
jgi:hypothetical protein